MSRFSDLLINKLSKYRFIGFIAIVFSFFFFNPLDIFAYTYVPEDIKITFWNSQNQTDSCEGLTQCYNFLPDKIANRVQTQSHKISFTEGRSYKMYISLKLSVPNEYYIYDFYLSDYNLRNYNINVDYNNFTFLYWDDFGWFNVYQWDLVLTVTPTFTSEGVSFDFYKNQAYNQAIWILDVLDFHSELLADSSDTGLIIDNNNKNTQDIIDNIDDLNNSINDDNIEGSKDTASSFFDNFSLEDNGGISAIITSPLKVIKGLISGGTCNNLEFSVLNKDLYFPSGCILWNNCPESILILYHTLICGFFSYFIGLSLFKDIESLKNPNDSGVSTLDL